MELNGYQKSVMNDLSTYLSILNDDNNLFNAWEHYWKDKDIAVGAVGGIPKYRNNIKGVPHICLKVPTGGGKTFMACAAIRRIFDKMPKDKPQVVVWLVPSDPILVQTTRNLMNTAHPYRMRLNSDFAGQVGVYTKEMLLNAQNFSPDIVRGQLTVCILSYATLRIDSTKKDVRKVYQENGNLKQFADYFKDDNVLLAETPDTALIQALRHLSPIVVVDESHNAGSDLSIEMLERLNPSLVLDLTATPRTNANILSYVDARELKKANMVKLPVIVYNRTSRNSVIQDAIQLRGILEKNAEAAEKTGGSYIRPIVLFQAQPKNSADSDTFDKVKKMLVDIGIPENQIAIKTSKVDDLTKHDLMSRDCPIRYIITVNALKEGWDCPFAYILASLANKTSRVEVEQIVGRVLRQPYATESSNGLLNTSYVITCSNDFHDTLENVVKGLNNAGFSRKDYLVGSDVVPPAPVPEVGQQTTLDNAETVPVAVDDDFSDIDTSAIDVTIPDTGDTAPAPDISAMLSAASKQAQEYKQESDESDKWGFVGGELGDMMKQFPVQDQFREQIKGIKLPQFCLKTQPDLFHEDGLVPLEKENLLDGFSLYGKDATINFALSEGEVYAVDVQNGGEAVPKYKRVSSSDSEYFHKLLERMAPDEKIEQCVESIYNDLNKDSKLSSISSKDLKDYVRRVVQTMSEDALSVIETSIFSYAETIKKKINDLQVEYAEQQFNKWITIGKITCNEIYSFPKVISSSETTDSLPLTLYEAEPDVKTNIEIKVRDVIASSEKVEWWHRIDEKKTEYEFRLNGFITHYPDFVVKMKSGIIMLVEAKGDAYDNSNSMKKLRLGNIWASNAGKNYRYFMVFDQNPISGAYKLEDFNDFLDNM